MQDLQDLHCYIHIIVVPLSCTSIANWQDPGDIRGGTFGDGYLDAWYTGRRTAPTSLTLVRKGLVMLHWRNHQILFKSQ
jgi:hypothetical protein